MGPDVIGDYLTGLLGRVSALSPISSANAGELPPLPPGFSIDSNPALPAGYRLNNQLGNLAQRAASPPQGDIVSNALAIDPTMAGSVVGGTLGTVSGGPVGGIAGTALGASIGKSGEQLYKGITGQKQYGSVRDVLGEYPSAVAEQTGYQILGQGIGSAITKGVGLAAPMMREGVARAQELLAPKGGTLSYGQMGHSSLVEPLESFARSGVGGKGIFLGLDKRNADALQAI